jgi:predicted transcriptional regulator
VLREYRKVKITHIIYKSNLSNNSVKPYIKNLSDNKLIEEVTEGEKRYFVLTQKGLEFLQEFKRMQTFTKSYGLGEL